MKWLYFLIAVLVVALATYFFWPHTKTPVTNYPSNGTDIIAFGDSLVEGYGATQGHGFVALLSKQIGQPIINLGRAGDTTAQGLLHISSVDVYSPKVIILVLGGNDAIQKVPVAETFSNLSKIIEYLQSKGAVVLLVGIRGGVLSDPYKPQFEKLASKYHTAYVPDALQGLFANPKYMSDEVHPNDAGYTILAARMLPVLQSLIQ